MRWTTLVMAGALALGLTMAQAGTIVDTGSPPEVMTITPAVAGWNQRVGTDSAAVGWSFTSPANVNADAIELPLWRVHPSPLLGGAVVTVALHADTAGLPGTMLRSVTLAPVDPSCYGDDCIGVGWTLAYTRAAFASVVALSSGTTYWVVVETGTSIGVKWLLNGSGGECAGGRVGACAWKRPNASGPWEACHEQNLFPTCSAAFRVTSP